MMLFSRSTISTHTSCFILFSNIDNNLTRSLIKICIIKRQRSSQLWFRKLCSFPVKNPNLHIHRTGTLGRHQEPPAVLKMIIYSVENAYQKSQTKISKLTQGISITFTAVTSNKIYSVFYIGIPIPLWRIRFHLLSSSQTSGNVLK